MSFITFEIQTFNTECILTFNFLIVSLESQSSRNSFKYMNWTKRKNLWTHFPLRYSPSLQNNKLDPTFLQATALYLQLFKTLSELLLCHLLKYSSICHILFDNLSLAVGTGRNRSARGRAIRVDVPSWEHCSQLDNYVRT